MCWNFNGCGDFCGGDFGEWVRIGWSGWKWVKGLGLLGRAWVSSLPIFFLGKCFHFWKLPPYLCINNRGNVYYPIFLTWYIVSKTNIEYIVLCIISVCMSVKMVLKMSGFYLGKARAGVLSLSQPLSLSSNPTKTPHSHNNLATATASNTASLHPPTLLLSLHATTPHTTQQPWSL